MKLFKNIKTGDTYLAEEVIIINTTNSEDGQEMILYCNPESQWFVREITEFYKKFKEIK
jgi:hypothetical protein